jgi:hypothetical protein
MYDYKARTKKAVKIVSKPLKQISLFNSIGETLNFLKKLFIS